jgi:hypothetical protein
MSSLSLSPLNKSPGYISLYWSHLVNVMLQHVGIHRWTRCTGQPPIKGCACALIRDSFLRGVYSYVRREKTWIDLFVGGHGAGVKFRVGSHE